MLSSIYAGPAQAQDVLRCSEKIKPLWLSGKYPEPANHTYYFKEVHGSGSSLELARRNAILTVVSDITMSKGVHISGTEIEQIKTGQSADGYQEETSRNYTYRFEFDKCKIAFEQIDEYWEESKDFNGNISYSCRVLFEVARNAEQVTFEKVYFSTSYGASALLRSMLIPGWGQMHKKNMTKGIVILSAEVTAIAGIIAMQNLHKNYRNKATVEWNKDVRESYNNKSQSYRNIRNGCIVAATAIYIYNIVDVLASKGAKRHKVTRFISALPYIDETDKGMGLSFALKF